MSRRGERSRARGERLSLPAVRRRRARRRARRSHTAGGAVSARVSARVCRLYQATLKVALSLLGVLFARALGAEPIERTPRLRTSLVWIFGDDDLLHAPADTTPV